MLIIIVKYLERKKKTNFFSLELSGTLPNDLLENMLQLKGT